MSSLEALEIIVNDHIKDGWKPQGGLTITNALYCQAMYKEK